MITKICAFCGKSFMAKNNKGKYCSDNCRSAYRYHNYKRHTIVCEGCGKQFKHARNDVSYCSKKCAGRGVTGNSLTIEDIEEYVEQNPQISVTKLVKVLGISNRKLYELLRENGYEGYGEYVAAVKGSYKQVERSDYSISGALCFEIIAKILNEEYETETTFDDLINPMTGVKLRFDCYFPSLKLVVEYNGVQHYKQVPFFHQGKNTLKYQKYRDSIKQKYCSDKNIKMVVISYRDELTEESLLKQLIKSEAIPSRAK